jgi:hypothetical protein
VRFEPETGILEIRGESYPENSQEFYGPLIAWLNQYLAEATDSVVFRVALSYMNTSSTKYMIEMLDRIEKAHEQGTDVRVEWYCDPDNARAFDTVEELKEDFSMPFVITTEAE